MRSILISILFLLTGLSLQGQISTNVVVEKQSTKIGEQNKFSVKIVSPSPSLIKSYSLEPFANIKPRQEIFKNDSMYTEINADIEFRNIDAKNLIELNSASFQQQADGKYVHLNDIDFICWDIGTFEIPNIKMNLDSAAQGYVLDTMINLQLFAVIPPSEMTEPDTTEMIAPILPIIIEEKSWKDWLWLVYLLLFFIVAALLIYLFLYRKRKELVQEEEVIIIRPSHEIAFEKLDDLEDRQLWQNGKVKEYQSELTYTIREYLENRFGIQALESTTGEINKSLKHVDFDPKHTTNLNNILQIADMVKFAKAKPEESIHQEFMDKARSLVNETLFIKKEEDDELVD